MNEVIHELSQQLASPDADERQAAALELAELEDPEAAPLLLRGLEDKEESVRRWSTYGLAKLGQPEHTPTLRRVLEKDPAAHVRAHAAIGLARLGERGVLEKLPEYLGAPGLETRWDTANALLSLQERAPLKPLLKPLLTSRGAHIRAWAAGLLHSLGEPEAYAKWLAALATPESRWDAALVVPLMHEPKAIRELVRLLARLSGEALAAREGERPSLEEHLTDALRLAGLDSLIGDGVTDEELRTDLLILLARHPYLLPEFVEPLIEALTQRSPEKMARELGRLVSAQEPGQRGRFFLMLARCFPSAALSTLAEMKGQDREQALQLVIHAAREAEGEDERLLALCEALRASPYGSLFEGLPTGPKDLPEDGEGDLDGATEELELPEEEPLGEELGLGDEEEAWAERLPPEAEAVAQRALVLGGLLRRLALEERLARGKDPASKEEIVRLQQWMDQEGLFSTLGITGMELLEAEPGTWSEEDRRAVAWSAEELHLLLWALNQGKAPPVETRAEVAPLLERLPLLKDPQPFLESAERRAREEVEAQRDRWEVLLECARYESFARGIASDPDLGEGDPDLELLLESAEEVGFDRKGVTARQGKATAVAEGLRHWSRHIVAELQQEGLLPGSPGEGLVFQDRRLPELDEDALAALLALAHGRFRALEWLAAGDEAPPEGEDEAG